MKRVQKKAFSDAAMFFSLNCGEFWTKKKRLYKTTKQPFKRKKNSVKTHVEFGILPMKKYIMGGNYQEKCFSRLRSFNAL